MVHISSDFWREPPFDGLRLLPPDAKALRQPILQIEPVGALMDNFRVITHENFRVLE